jgi:hypothetical protein
MNFSFLVFLFFNMFIVNCKNNKRNVNSVSIAFEEITKVLTKLNREVTIMNYSNDEGMFDKFLLKTLKNQNLPLKIKSKYKRFLTNGPERDPSYRRHLVQDSAILLFDSIEALKKFNPITRFDNLTPKPMDVFVFCKNATMKEVETLADESIKSRNKPKDLIDQYFNDLNDILNFQYFIVDEAKSIKLLTFVWYTRQACHVPQLIEVNRFDKKTKKWKSSKFAIKKCQNFHGCELIIGLENSHPHSAYNISNTC